MAELSNKLVLGHTLCIFLSSVVPAHVLSVVEVLMFVLAVLLHGRQVEWTARLDFLWQVQANEEKREMDALQHSNKRILFNLLPAHVATHFLDNQFRNNMVSLCCVESDVINCFHDACAGVSQIICYFAHASWLNINFVFIFTFE